MVGLMCQRCLSKGIIKIRRVETPAMALGSAFQKVNLRFKSGFRRPERSYFPEVNLNEFTDQDKNKIIQEIDDDFQG